MRNKNTNLRIFKKNNCFTWRSCGLMLVRLSLNNDDFKFGNPKPCQFFPGVFIISMHSTQKISFLIIKYLELIIFSSAVLYFGRTLFIPLFFGLLIAMIMHPICRWLENHKWHKTLAILGCLFIVTILIAALASLLIWQMNVFGKDAKSIFSRVEFLMQDLQTWLAENTGLSTDINANWEKNFNTNIGILLKSSLQVTINTLFILFLTPVFTALFMYHRKIFVQVLKQIIPPRYSSILDSILQKTIRTYFNYIKGMLLVYVIVGILNSIGLFALGVKHAILFGFLCSISTIIPYIGIFISALLPISVVWLDTNNIWYVAGVIAVFSFVQYLEANVIFPKVVGAQLEVSTLAMLIAVIAGGIIWGVSGMILFVPFVAILKIVSDYFEELKPLNLLLSRK